MSLPSQSKIGLSTVLACIFVMSSTLTNQAVARAHCPQGIANPAGLIDDIDTLVERLSSEWSYETRSTALCMLADRGKEAAEKAGEAVLEIVKSAEEGEESSWQAAQLRQQAVETLVAMEYGAAFDELLDVAIEEDARQAKEEKNFTLRDAIAQALHTLAKLGHGDRTWVWLAELGFAERNKFLVGSELREHLYSRPLTVEALYSDHYLQFKGNDEDVVWQREALPVAFGYLLEYKPMSDEEGDDAYSVLLEDLVENYLTTDKEFMVKDMETILYYLEFNRALLDLAFSLLAQATGDNDDQRSRQRATAALGFLDWKKNDEVVILFIARLDDADGEVRRQAALGLKAKSLERKFAFYEQRAEEELWRTIDDSYALALAAKAEALVAVNINRADEALEKVATALLAETDKDMIQALSNTHTYIQRQKERSTEDSS